VVGLTPRRGEAAGQPIALDDLERPGVIAKGGHVTLQITLNGLTATAQGVALAAGAPGDHIEVLNPISRMIVQGEVLGSGMVAVTPGSLPIPAGAQVAVR